MKARQCRGRAGRPWLARREEDNACAGTLDGKCPATHAHMRTQDSVRTKDGTRYGSTDARPTGSHDPHRVGWQLPQASPTTSSRRRPPLADGDRRAAPRRHAGPSQRGRRRRKPPSAIPSYTADTYHTQCHLSVSLVDAHLSPTAAATPLIGATPPHRDHRSLMIRRCSPRTL